MADNEQELSNKDISLLDLVDRILAKGVILKGDITISVADIDLIYLGLKVLLSNVDKAEELREHQWEKMKRGEA
ncbi:MAG: gas vesicle protein [Halanaerobiales bacterium]|nr:gas vesicle protein [Halanaerobiales bacterium]